MLTSIPGAGRPVGGYGPGAPGDGGNAGSNEEAARFARCLVSKPDADAARLARLTRRARISGLIAAVANADPSAIENATRQLGESRKYLAPIAWAAGAMVLLVQGVKLLILNWRLSLVQLIPAAWIWLTSWDLKQHLLHGSAFEHLNLLERIVLIVGIICFTIAAFWCNAVFAFAIDQPPPPRVRPAWRRAREGRRLVVVWGLAVGGALAFATVAVPRFAGVWVFSLILSAVLGIMLISFVAVPARIIGVKRAKLPPKEALGRAAAGGTLSAVAMAPGFLLGRFGLILLGLHHFHFLGFVMLSIGTALYAAGMSSVKAVKLSMKLAPAPAVASAGTGPEASEPDGQPASTEAVATAHE